MYGDDVFSYRNFNIQEIQGSNSWLMYYWSRNNPYVDGKEENRYRRKALVQAKAAIDKLLENGPISPYSKELDIS